MITMITIIPTVNEFESAAEKEEYWPISPKNNIDEYGGDTVYANHHFNDTQKIAEVSK